MRYQALTRFFMWNTIINAAFLFGSSLLVMSLSPWHYEFSNQLFPLSKENYNLIIIGFLGLYKLFIFLFNLVPFLALLIMNKARQTRELRVVDEELGLSG